MKTTSAVVILLTLTSTALAGLVLPPPNDYNITATATLNDLVPRKASDWTCKGTDRPMPNMHLDEAGCKGITAQICADHAVCTETTIKESTGKECKVGAVSYSKWGQCKYVNLLSLSRTSYPEDVHFANPCLTRIDEPCPWLQRQHGHEV
jgi:hypothetical protein